MEVHGRIPMIEYIHTHKWHIQNNGAAIADIIVENKTEKICLLINDKWIELTIDAAIDLSNALRQAGDVIATKPQDYHGKSIFDALTVYPDVPC